MNIRPVKDIIDNKTNQPIFIKSHAKATFMSNGKNVEDVIYDIEKNELATTTTLTDLNERVNNITNMASIEYETLKSLRDVNQLKPGTWYRITDYVTTTAQENTQSANHPFDVLVLATSENALSEEARAIQHDEDTYFVENGANLDAWEIKYTLDNDTDKFAWADSANGKGVIYYMKDEWSNECPYDFKNIQFKRKLSNGVLDTENGVDTWCYTFNAYYRDKNNPNIYDASVITYKEKIEGDANICYGNIIKEYYEVINYVGSVLNDIVFLNKYGNESWENFNCSSNSFGNDCHSNTFGNDCHDNSFGDECYSNSFGNECYSNSFGNDCYSNTFGNNYYSNIFGNRCYSNTFGDNCNNNTFGNNCYSNSFGTFCNYNSFGNGCSYNSFGNSGNHNSFGDRCYSNSFGSVCVENSFGNGCHHNSFRNSASKDDTLKDHIRYNHFDDGCCYTVIWNSDTTSSGIELKNVNVNRGVSGTSSSYNYINIDVLNQDYEIQVAKNSNGEIKIYCEADLIS